MPKDIKEKKERTPAWPVLKRLWKESSQIHKQLALFGLINVLSVALAILAPEMLGRMTQQLYDFEQTRGVFPWQALIQTGILLAIVFLGSAVFDILRMYLQNHTVTGKFTCGLRVRMSEKLKRVTMRFADSTPKGEVISRMMRDVSVIGMTTYSFLDLITSGVLKLLGIIIICFVLQPYVALVVLVMTPLSVFLSARLSSRSEKYYSQMSDTNGKLYSINEEDFGGFETVQAYHLQERQRLRHKKICDDLQSQGQKAFFLGRMVEPIISFSNNLTFLGICVLGGYLALTGALNVGAVVAFVLYAKMIAGPLESIAGGISQFQWTLAAARRVFEVLDEPVTELPEEPKTAQGTGEVCFEKVCFSYNKEAELIQDLSFSVHPGQKVAIVGPTGAGKTTIVNLLLRFYELDGGRILIDGVDAREMDPKHLRSLFSMVLQDTWLFSGTLFENLAYGKEGASLEEVKAAAKRAHINRFIASLPGGYEAQINEESSNISGGQKQMLTIARAFVADRPILILDEATSNVDTRTELLIQKTMDDLLKNRTSFVIAHRLSTIVNADLILVMRDGQIVEQGTHSSLLAKDGFYAEIYNSQYAAITEAAG
ncbi:MAG: ABC transporter ATP-binding protein/permease [Clostridiales bacterium]|nr:ABC transporter ATP-binding protein/permease [Clostridiales bacterium]